MKKEKRKSHVRREESKQPLISWSSVIITRNSPPHLNGNLRRFDVRDGCRDVRVGERGAERVGRQRRRNLLARLFRIRARGVAATGIEVEFERHV